MRLTYLYLRSRQVERALALLLALAGAALLWRRISDGNPLNDDLMITGLPVAAAIIIGPSTASPFREVEETAGHWLRSLRLPHLCGLIVLAACGLALATTSWHVIDLQWSLARNVLLFTGLGFLGARLLGAGLEWLLPVTYGFLAFLATLLAAAQPGHQLLWAKSSVRWAWTLHAGRELEAAVVASGVLLVGLGLMVLSGARDGLAESA
jgi:hypothetical protein